MRHRFFGLVVAGLALLVSLWAYPQLPARIATHWNAHGVPNGSSPRLFAALLLPVLILALTGVFAVLPKIDPRGANYQKFTSAYWLMVNALLVFLLGMHALVLAHGLGVAVSMNRVVLVGLGVLFAFLGNYLTRVEPNWFVGIRTPWTLSSDSVWHETHRVGGRTFVLGGVAIVVAALLPAPFALPLAIAALVVTPLTPVVLSYVLWRRDRDAGA